MLLQNNHIPKALCDMAFRIESIYKICRYTAGYDKINAKEVRYGNFNDKN